MGESAGSAPAITNSTRATGREKKIIHAPFDVMSDWRRLSSNVGEITGRGIAAQQPCSMIQTVE